MYQERLIIWPGHEKNLLKTETQSDISANLILEGDNQHRQEDPKCRGLLNSEGVSQHPLSTEIQSAQISCPE